MKSSNRFFLFVPPRRSARTQRMLPHIWIISPNVTLILIAVPYLPDRGLLKRSNEEAYVTAQHEPNGEEELFFSSGRLEPPREDVWRGTNSNSRPKSLGLWHFSGAKISKYSKKVARFTRDTLPVVLPELDQQRKTKSSNAGLVLLLSHLLKRATECTRRQSAHLFLSGLLNRMTAPTLCNKKGTG